jgi:hypothetical protein
VLRAARGKRITVGRYYEQAADRHRAAHPDRIAADRLARPGRAAARRWCRWRWRCCRSFRIALLASSPPAVAATVVASVCDGLHRRRGSARHEGASRRAASLAGPASMIARNRGRYSGYIIHLGVWCVHRSRLGLVTEATSPCARTSGPRSTATLASAGREPRRASTRRPPACAWAPGRRRMPRWPRNRPVLVDGPGLTRDRLATERDPTWSSAAGGRRRRPPVGVRQPPSVGWITGTRSSRGTIAAWPARRQPPGPAGAARRRAGRDRCARFSRRGDAFASSSYARARQRRPTRTSSLDRGGG